MTYWVSYYVKSNGREMYNTTLFQSTVSKEVTVEYVANGWYKVTRRATDFEVRNRVIDLKLETKLFDSTTTLDEILIMASMEVARRNT